MSAKERRIRAKKAHRENQTVAILQEVREFQEFRDSLLPVLRADLKNGTPAKEILEKVKALAAARLGHIMMTENDSGKALSAISQVLDRTDGKAKESVKHTHQLEELPSQQLESLLATEIATLKAKASKNKESH
jgi:hypothetical protein